MTAQLSASPATVSLPEFDVDTVAATDLESVEAVMRRLARGSRVGRAGTMVLEQLTTGGKRLRARLALQMCHSHDVSSDEAIPWAAAVELLHNATLVHDDVQDGDRTRRGHPTVWAKHGIAQAINAGDLLLMLPFIAIGELGRESGPLMLEVARAAAEAVRGQAEELGLLASGRLDMESYRAAAAGKTGALLALPVRGALVLSGLPSARIDALGDLFVELGILFQLQDDVADLFGDKGRAQVGSDICEGRVSALVVAQAELEPSSVGELLAILHTPREETTVHQILHAKRLFRESGALRAVLAQICEIAARVLTAAPVAANPAILGTASSLVDRSLAPVRHLLNQPERW